MQLQAEQIVDVLDSQQRYVGEIVIERLHGNLITGKFISGPAFPAVQYLFRAFEEAVNNQALSVVDELDHAIAALNLHVRPRQSAQCVDIHDVQIWSDNTITCRIRAETLSEGDGSGSVAQRLSKRL